MSSKSETNSHRQQSDSDYLMSIAEQEPGFSVLKKLQEVQTEAKSPLREDAQPWLKGWVGEDRVGRRLNELRAEGYTVLHGVPIGKNGTDIDHVVVTPTGHIYTINTKNHEGAQIWVAGKAFMVNGVKESYIHKSMAEAARAEKILRGLAHSDLTVQALIVVTGHEKLTIKHVPEVEVIESRNVLAWIRCLEGNRVSRGDKNEAAIALAKSGALFESKTWTGQESDDAAGQEDRVAWLTSLQASIKKDKAQRRKVRVFGSFVAFIAVVGIFAGVIWVVTSELQ